MNERTLRSEFPDYDEPLSIRLGTEFELQPWHNDTCPRYQWVGVTDDARLKMMELCLWVDYKDPEKREDDRMRRFVLTTEDGQTNEYVEVLFAETWADLREACLKRIYETKAKGWDLLPQYSAITDLGTLLFQVGALDFITKRAARIAEAPPPAAPVEQWIFVTGSPWDGFEFIGPFADSDDAEECSLKTDGAWWIGTLTPPAKLVP